MSAFQQHLSLTSETLTGACVNQVAFSNLHKDCSSGSEDVALTIVDYPANINDPFIEKSTSFKICKCSHICYQLLQAGWMFTSFHRPQIAVSFRVLEGYRRLMMRAYVSIQSYVAMINNSFASNDSIIKHFSQASHFYRSLFQAAKCEQKEHTDGRCPICPVNGHIHLAIDACVDERNRGIEQVNDMYVEERRCRPTGIIPNNLLDPPELKAARIDATIYSLVQEILHLNGIKHVQKGYNKTQDFISSYRGIKNNLTARIAERNEKGTPLAQLLTKGACLDLSSWYYHGRLLERRAIDAFCFFKRTEEERKLLHSHVLYFKRHLTSRVSAYQSQSLSTNSSDIGARVAIEDVLTYMSSHLEFIERHLQACQRGQLEEPKYNTDSMLAALEAIEPLDAVKDEPPEEVVDYGYESEMDDNFWEMELN